MEKWVHWYCIFSCLAFFKYLFMWLGTSERVWRLPLAIRFIILVSSESPRRVHCFLEASPTQCQFTIPETSARVELTSLTNHLYHYCELVWISCYWCVIISVGEVDWLIWCFRSLDYKTLSLKRGKRAELNLSLVYHCSELIKISLCSSGREIINLEEENRIIWCLLEFNLKTMRFYY